MFFIPIGLIFVFFYINMDIGGFTIDLLLDAVGYILIAVAIAKRKEHSFSFSKALPLCAILAVYSFAVRLLQPVGLLGILVSLVELLMQLYLLRLLTSGVRELEYGVGTHLNSAILDCWREWLSVSMIASYVCAIMKLFVPAFTFLGYVIAAVWAVLCILFIVVFFRTSRRYRLLLRHNSECQQDGAEANE